MGAGVVAGVSGSFMTMMSRSAMAAVRGQMRESMVSGMTNSLHMQASPPRTLERASGEVVAYRETVHGQAAVSLANLRTFAEHREEILRDYLAHRRAACEPVTTPGQGAYLVEPSADVEVDARLLRALLSQGIEVRRASKAFEASDVTGPLGDREATRRFPAGTWIVPAAQPQGAMVRAYLEFDPRLDAEFLQEERESIERGRGSKVYDVTAWCLGRQLGVKGHWASLPEVESTPAEPLRAPAGPPWEGDGAYAWVTDGADRRALRFAARAMELGLQVHVSDHNLTADNTGYKETRQLFYGHKILALDTEMVYTTKGLEVARVTLLDSLGFVVYDRFVRPDNRIVDYNTRLVSIVFVARFFFSLRTCSFNSCKNP